MLLTLSDEISVRSRDGDERTIPATGLLAGPFETTLAPTELLTQVRIPSPTGPGGGTYLKLERKVGDFATAAAAVQLTLGAGGEVTQVGIGLTAMGETPVKATDAERFLKGKKTNGAAITETSRRAAAATDPTADRRGAVEYKREMARVLTERALRLAIQRAGGTV